MFFSIVGLKATPLEGLLERMQKGLSHRFEIKIKSNSDQQDYFNLVGGGKKVMVTANSYVNAAFGINWYLKYYCNVNMSFCENHIPVLPNQLPSVNERHQTSLTQNLYLNYCTFSYTTAFWDWKRWEQEIDLMALNGVTTPMAMVGVEVVWRNVLRKLGYSVGEIKEFLCGPAYMGWLLMGNMEKLGGPLPDEWFEQQTALQKKILSRMREYGMKPIFQGFFGMVPNSLPAKYPDAHYLEQGKWNSLKRPLILDPSDPLFDKIAKVWYAEYKQLFGMSDFFGGDLFHEGGRTDGIDVSEAAFRVQKAMLNHNPKATWVLQAWGGNPKKELLAGLDKNHTLVFDICAEFWDNWRQRKGFEGFPWVWGHLTNYGGNIGLHGRLDAIAKGPIEGKQDEVASICMKGIGACPEGIEVNPVTFELANEMRWRNQTPDLKLWLDEYVERRYGIDDENLKKAWDIFHQTAYGTYKGHRRPSESVFCAQPSLKGIRITASAWSQCRIFYDSKQYAKGVELFLKSAASLSEEPTYQYDAVDFVRQYITNLGRDTYYQLVDAYNNKNIEKFEKCSNLFLALLEDQDKLLSTHERFFVSRWLQMARMHSANEEISDLYEYNARLLIGTWTENRSPVRDYAHKEWGGMLRDYYYPRWKTYLDYLSANLKGNNQKEPDFFASEKKWVVSHNMYSLSKEHPVKTALNVFNKYHTQSLFKEFYFVQQRNQVSSGTDSSFVSRIDSSKSDFINKKIE